MQKLPTNMPNPDNIQISAHAHRQKTNTNPPPRDRHKPIWIQTRAIDSGRNPENRKLCPRRGGSQIRLMGLSKAFDRINRTQLWTTLNRKGLHGEIIKQIREGHKNTHLCTKYQGRYGQPQANNVGVFQGFGICALMFIIYLDDVMEDYEAINRKAQLPTRLTMQRDPVAETQILLGNIAQQTTKNAEKAQNNNQEKQRQTKPKRATPEAETKLHAEDSAIYADDTNLYLRQEPQHQTITRLQRYSLMTHTRNMAIQWAKVLLLTRRREKYRRTAATPLQSNSRK